MTFDDTFFSLANGIFSLTVIIHECKIEAWKTLLSQKCILKSATDQLSKRR